MDVETAELIQTYTYAQEAWKKKNKELTAAIADLDNFLKIAVARETSNDPS